MLGIFQDWYDYWFPPHSPQVAHVLKTIGEVFFDFGLYSDRKTWYGSSYIVGILARAEPLVAGGILKIQIHAGLLPRGVLVQDLLNPTLLTALSSALDLHVEIVHQPAPPVERSAVTGQPVRASVPGLFPWSRGQESPESDTVWVRVELDSEMLRGIPREVLLEDLPEPDPNHFLSWPMGIIQGGLAYFADYPTEIMSMFCSGATRTGKSTHIRAGLDYLNKWYDTGYYQIYILDCKDDKTDYVPFLKCPNYKFFEEPGDFLDGLHTENLRRGKLRRASGAFNVFQHNDMKDVDHIPYLIAIIDEMYLFALKAKKGKGDTKGDMEIFQTMVATMLSNGIYPLVGTQRPSVDVVSGGSKTNFHTRMSFSQPSAIDGEVVFGNEEFGKFVERIGQVGRGYCAISDKFFEFQSAYSTGVESLVHYQPYQWYLEDSGLLKKEG